jgi:hypothetical protein
MTLHDYLQMSFVQNALLVGVLVARKNRHIDMVAALKTEE